MKEPKYPLKSGKFIHCHDFEEKHLISKTYVHPDCIERFEERWEDRKEEGDEPPNLEEWWYHTYAFSLQDILSVVPPGTDPNLVVIHVQRERDCQSVDVDVILRTPTDKVAWQAGQDAEEADWQQRFAIYEKEMAVYEKWKIEQNIKELEEKLSKLKK